MKKIDFWSLVKILLTLAIGITLAVSLADCGGLFECYNPLKN